MALLGPATAGFRLVRPMNMADGASEMAWLREEGPLWRVRADARASVRLRARVIGSAEQRECLKAGEGGGQLGRPAPVVLEVQGDLAGATVVRPARIM